MYSRAIAALLLKTNSGKAPPLKLPSIFDGDVKSVTSSTVVFAKFATPPASITNAATPVLPMLCGAVLKKSAPTEPPAFDPPPAPELFIFNILVAAHSILSKNPSALKLPPPVPGKNSIFNCKLLELGSTPNDACT